MTINNHVVGLRISPQKATNIVQTATIDAGNEPFSRGMKKYWHVVGQQGVRKQSLCWLYAWAHQSRMRQASDEAKGAFNKIFDMKFENFPGGFIDEAKKQRHQDNGQIVSA